MTVEEKIEVETIAMAWVVVKDLDRAIAFYKDVMGLEVFQHTPAMHWAEMKAKDGARLGLAESNDQEIISAGSNAIVCMNVKDLDVTLSVLKAKGAELIGEVIEIPGHVKMQYVKDESGNTFQCVQEF